MAKNMGSRGVTLGDMSPTVSDYQKPTSCFAESQFGTTTEYIARQDKYQHKEAKELSKQGYKGRYS